MGKMNGDEGRPGPMQCLAIRLLDAQTNDHAHQVPECAHRFPSALRKADEGHRVGRGHEVGTGPAIDYKEPVDEVVVAGLEDLVPRVTTRVAEGIGYRRLP